MIQQQVDTPQTCRQQGDCSQVMTEEARLPQLATWGMVDKAPDENPSGQDQGQRDHHCPHAPPIDVTEATH